MRCAHGISEESGVPVFLFLSMLLLFAVEQFVRVNETVQKGPVI